MLSLRPLSQAWLTSTSAWVAFKWPHFPLASRQPTVIHHIQLADEFGHGFSCFVGTCGGENGTNGNHLAVFSEDVAFAHHFMAPYLPLTLPPYRSANGIGHASKNYLKW